MTEQLRADETHCQSGFSAVKLEGVRAANRYKKAACVVDSLLLLLALT